MKKFHYEIQADSAHEAAVQFMQAYKRLNPHVRRCAFDFEDGSKIVVTTKKGK